MLAFVSCVKAAEFCRSPSRSELEMFQMGVEIVTIFMGFYMTGRKNSKLPVCYTKVATFMCLLVGRAAQTSVIID